jgi:hypothetical protein
MLTDGARRKFIAIASQRLVPRDPIRPTPRSESAYMRRREEVLH